MLERLQAIQELVCGTSTPAEFNERALKMISECERERLEVALDTVAEETPANIMVKIDATKVIADFFKIVDNIRQLNSASNQWLTTEKFDAGVDKDGGIMIWVKNKPEEFIRLAAVQTTT